ncbi:MAG: hypothetical protein GX537_03085 [Actinobacteria bacterium]|nr:hypothetical protein [Actinomycetota bacterium]
MAWSRAHEAARQKIIELLHREERPFEDMSDGAVAERRALPFLDWCQFYMPHYFAAPFARFHGQMAEAVGEAAMPTFVCAFRGAGKSVLLALARPLYRTLRREVPYWIYGAGVQQLAAQNMDYVRIELEHNPRIAADYPGLRCEGTETDWQVEQPRERNAAGQWALRATKFEAFGIGMSPRGRRFGQYRPTEFVGDDLEDAQLARNPRREQQLWDWLMDEVVPALEPDVWSFTVLGTMFGPDCMLERARQKSKERDPAGRPLAKYFRQPAQDAEGRSVWPERFSDDGLARIRSMIGLRNWLRNYALTADDPDKPFQPQWFSDRYESLPKGLDVVAFLDPAISQAPTGCPRALVAIGCDRDGVRYVLDAWIERGSPEQMMDSLFRYRRSWEPRLIGIEQNGGYALIKPLLQTWERSKGWRLPVRYVDHHENKDSRIQRLAPEMESGRWRWPARPSAGVRVLEQQFLSYPDGFVDGPDAAAGCTEFLPSAWGGGRRPGAAEHRSIKRRDYAGVL